MIIIDKKCSIPTMSREGGRFYGAPFSEKYAATLTSVTVKKMVLGLCKTLFFTKPLSMRFTAYHRK